MPFTSSTTLLQLVNKCLVSIGERPVSSIANFPSQKARDAITSALQQLGTLNDWFWLKNSANATGWVGAVASLPDFQRLYGVTYRLAPNSGVQLQYLDRKDFPWLDATSGATAGAPQYYTLDNQSSVRVHPYPATTTEQNKIIFHYIQALSLPATESSGFPIPERFIPLLMYGALVDLCQSHLDDQQASRFYKNQFDELGAKLRVREPGIGIGTRNVYRRNRKRSYPII